MNADAAARRRRALLAVLGVASALLLLAGLAAGGEGWSLRGLSVLLQGPDAGLIVGQIRAPRTLGAWLTGALLGLAGALAQGLFRNPLADPFLLGSASGASLAVVVVLAAGTLLRRARMRRRLRCGPPACSRRSAWWRRPSPVRWAACCSPGCWRAARSTRCGCCWPASSSASCCPR